MNLNRYGSLRTQNYNYSNITIKSSGVTPQIIFLTFKNSPSFIARLNLGTVLRVWRTEDTQFMKKEESKSIERIRCSDTYS